MHIVRFRNPAILFLFGFLTTVLPAQGPGAGAGKSTPPPAPAPPSPTAVYPEIVRIGYLEGDVRVTRGAQAEKATGTTWEKAVANLPIETGYNLVTGAGRAEIEFEDASTVYLAENSVLVFSDLKTAGGVPHTELSLLAGTATLHLRPESGESFILKTPTDGVTTSFPGKAYLRITSYSDAIAITPQKDESYQLDAPGSAVQKSAKGQTQYFNNGLSIAPPAQSDETAFAAWDAWVADRVKQRSAAMTAVMKDAGLTAPLPGLADMRAGRFLSMCALRHLLGSPRRSESAANDRPTACRSAAARLLTGFQTTGSQPGAGRTGHRLSLRYESERLFRPCRYCAVPAGWILMHILFRPDRPGSAAPGAACGGPVAPRGHIHHSIHGSIRNGCAPGNSHGLRLHGPAARSGAGCRAGRGFRPHLPVLSGWS